MRVVYSHDFIGICQYWFLAKTDLFFSFKSQRKVSIHTCPPPPYTMLLQVNNSTASGLQFYLPKLLFARCLTIWAARSVAPSPSSLCTAGIQWDPTPEATFRVILLHYLLVTRVAAMPLGFPHVSHPTCPPARAPHPRGQGRRPAWGSPGGDMALSRPPYPMVAKALCYKAAGFQFGTWASKQDGSSEVCCKTGKQNASCAVLHSLASGNYLKAVCWHAQGR